MIFLLYNIQNDYLKEKIGRLFKKGFFRKVIAAVLCASMLFTCCFVSVKKNTYYSSYVSNQNDDQEQLKHFICNSDYKFELPLRMGGLSSTENNVIHPVYYSAKKSLKFFITYYKSTIYYKLTSEFGTDNMYRSLLEDNVCFVDKNDSDTQVDYMLNYLNKYYSKSKSVRYKLLKDCGNYSVYKFFEK